MYVYTFSHIILDFQKLEFIKNLCTIYSPIRVSLYFYNTTLLHITKHPLLPITVV